MPNSNLYTVVSQLKRFSNLDKLKDYNLFLNRFSSNLGAADGTPSIGFIGKRFFSSKFKVCFLAKAGGESRFLNELDRISHEKLLAFYQSGGSEQIEKFREYNEFMKSHVQNWPIFKIPKLLIDKAAISINDVSYVNIVPYRYKGQPIKSVYQIAWRTFTNKYLKVLKPNLIIPLGKNLRDDADIDANYKGGGIVTNGISRTNGDTFIRDEAREQIEEIVSLYW